MVYNKIFLFPCLALVSITLLSGFTSPSEEDLVKSLLTERAMALQQAYFGDTTAPQLEDTLRKVETQPLLGQDVAAFKETGPTDMDVVMGLQVISLKKNTGLYGYRSFTATVLWKMRNLSGTYEEVVEYNIVLKFSGEQYRLSILELK